ncbi:MAG: hypothetical protein LBG99_08335 [Propionibacteriaceae bacterium]|jgi:hypothetical protein|nr:hypothetical protein [Propionibacteriaceae bacterium]
MASRRKTLPDDFEQMLATASFEELVAVFDKTSLDAYGGYHKGTALSFATCPDELSRWLVAQGLDVDGFGKDIYTPLTTRIDQGAASIQILLDLGASVEGINHSPGYQYKTPLITAAGRGGTLTALTELVEAGANLITTYCDRNAMDTAVWSCDDRSFEEALPKIEYLALLTKPKPTGIKGLFARPTPVFTLTDEIRKAVRCHGRELETQRVELSNHTSEIPCYSCEQFAKYEPAVLRLYELFDLPPVPPIRKHDGVSPITVVSTEWRKQHAELWDLLVPMIGPTETAQGEAIRISGRLGYEILGNGGVNWDGDYQAMQDTLLDILASGNPCNPEQLALARQCVQATRKGTGDEAHLDPLSQLAVSWVLANPQPLPRPWISYKR